jgi:cytidylate kinase
MIIAIDGPAASGKGTMAKRLAAHYGLRHLDTGVIYRAVAHAMLAAGPSMAMIMRNPPLPCTSAEQSPESWWR